MKRCETCGNYEVNCLCPPPAARQPSSIYGFIGSAHSILDFLKLNLHLFPSERFVGSVPNDMPYRTHGPNLTTSPAPVYGLLKAAREMRGARIPEDHWFGVPPSADDDIDGRCLQDVAVLGAPTALIDDVSDMYYYVRARARENAAREHYDPRNKVALLAEQFALMPKITEEDAQRMLEELKRSTIMIQTPRMSGKNSFLKGLNIP